MRWITVAVPVAVAVAAGIAIVTAIGITVSVSISAGVAVGASVAVAVSIPSPAGIEWDLGPKRHYRLGWRRRRWRRRRRRRSRGQDDGAVLDVGSGGGGRRLARNEHLLDHRCTRRSCRRQCGRGWREIRLVSVAVTRMARLLRRRLGHSYVECAAVARQRRRLRVRIACDGRTIGDAVATRVRAIVVRA